MSTSDRSKARAAHAEVLAAWAQYLRDDADDLRRAAARLEKGPSGSGSGDPKVLRSRARKLETLATSRAREALKIARQAHLMTQQLETKRALLEASRVAREPADRLLRLFNEAVSMGPDDPELNYIKAMMAYDQGKLEQAQQLLRGTIDQWNQKGKKPFFRAQMRLARVYWLRGKSGEALTVLRSISVQNPGHKRAGRLLRLLSGTGPVSLPASTPTTPGVPPTARAVTPLAPDGGVTAAPLAPADYAGLVKRAEQLAFGGKKTEARKLYEQALKLDPRGVEALTGLGFAWLDARQVVKAMALFLRALRVSKNYGEALIGVAESNQRQGKVALAVAFFRRYLRHHPAGRRAIHAKQSIRDLTRRQHRPMATKRHDDDDDPLPAGVMMPMSRPLPIARPVPVVIPAPPPAVGSWRRPRRSVVGS